jgi:hypothetical protein
MQMSSGGFSSTASATHSAPVAQVPPQVGYDWSEPQRIGAQNGSGLGGATAQPNPFGQSAPPCPHAPGFAQKHPTLPPKIGSWKPGRQTSVPGQTPPQTGAPGLPHGVSPVGMHPHALNGGGPVATHCSPVAQVPLQVGAVSPHGDVGWLQTQPSRPGDGPQTPPSGHVPPHCGNGVVAHGGADAQPPAVQASQQLASFPTHAVPCFGATHFAPSSLTVHDVFPLAAVRQHVTARGSPHVDLAAQRRTNGAQLGFRSAAVAAPFAHAT